MGVILRGIGGQWLFTLLGGDLAFNSVDCALALVARPVSIRGAVC